eukprot:9200936-Lingulodinium_polyedra.AAC.1
MDNMLEKGIAVAGGAWWPMSRSGQTLRATSTSCCRRALRTLRSSWRGASPSAGSGEAVLARATHV